MAIIWMDGFNTYGTAYFAQNYIGTTSTSIGTTGRYDGSSITVNDVTTGTAESSRLLQGLHLPISPISTMSVGIAFSRNSSSSWPNGLGATLPQFIFYNGSVLADAAVANNMIAGVSISAPAVVGPWTVNIMNRSGNLIQTVINNWNSSSNAWNYVEIELQASATVGFVRVYVNGILATSITNVNLSTSTGGILINKVGILPNNWSSGGAMLYDDYYITNTTTRLGEMHIATLRPSADTATKQWTPSTGVTNYDKVTGANYNTLTPYVSTNASGRKDLYDLQDVNVATTITGNIAAVKANGYGYKSTFGTSNVNMIIKSSTTEINGTGTDMIEGTAAAKPISAIIQETDPATSLAWTTAGVNAAQLGIRSN